MEMVAKNNDNGMQWRCRRPCIGPKKFRNNTFFDSSKLPLATIVKFIYLWAHEELPYHKVNREFDMSHHAFVDWKMFLQDICTKHFIRHPFQIGDPGIVMEVDESVLSAMQV